MEAAYARLSGSLFRDAVAAAQTAEALEAVRVEALGRKSGLTELLKGLKDLTLDEKREFAPKVQALKAELEGLVARRRAELEAAADEASLQSLDLDLSLPAVAPARGRLHPLTLTLQEMSSIFSLMGYSWAEGPLVEDERHNFEALNIPEHHAARDLQDTFYLQDVPLLLRTHTSPVQIRTMESARPPLRVICPGRVFRHEAVDATHSAVFHQVEGLAVDQGITFADLKGTLQTFLQRLFGPQTKTRFLPSYYPFTEPSADVYASCIFCSGAGCPICKQSGWIEIMGAGMVHPNVFKAVDYDPETWSGFAFGIGVDRVAMLRLGVPDLRLFYENDLRFLRQFDESLV
ncbi:MAG: phenylalanine--tRNA ligase subunit alpha [Elusimicrobia bacterium]|nr:phenylalanine--tRNA ligase subunit alpha [Elusimicrobiota bacterium]